MLDDLRRRERNRPASAPALVVISSGSAEANREQGFSSLVLLDDAFQAGQAFGVSGTPAALFLDETGRGHLRDRRRRRCGAGDGDDMG